MDPAPAPAHAVRHRGRARRTRALPVAACLSAPLALCASAAVAAAASGPAPAADPALLGCWRTEQVHATWSDGRSVDSNSDCVTEFDAGVARSRCHTPSGLSEVAMRYQVTAPGHLRWRPTGPEAQDAGGVDVDYAIDGPFVVTTRRPTLPVAGGGDAPAEVKVLSVRVWPLPAEGCQPRRPSTLRIGRSPRSALALTLPPGWRASLVDPETTPALARSIGNDFFLGAFVRRPAPPAAVPAASGTSASAAPRPAPPADSPMVIVLDVSRFGAAPVREPEFDSLKRDMAARLDGAEETCDTPERACFLLRTPQGPLGYTELVLVRPAGRAAIVSAVGPRVGAVPAAALVNAVRTFATRLLADNR